jgi:hypothetical protein
MDEICRKFKVSVMLSTQRWDTDGRISVPLTAKTWVRVSLGSANDFNNLDGLLKNGKRVCLLFVYYRSPNNFGGKSKWFV